MKYITKEKAVKSLTVDEDGMTVDRMLSTTRKGEGIVQNHWVMDFSGCTTAQLLELASRTVVITKQGQFRTADKSDAGLMVDMTVDVADELKRERKPATMTPEKAVAMAAGMTDEARAALIASLEAMGDSDNVK